MIDPKHIYEFLDKESEDYINGNRAIAITNKITRICNGVAALALAAGWKLHELSYADGMVADWTLLSKERAWILYGLDRDTGRRREIARVTVPLIALLQRDFTESNITVTLGCDIDR